MTRRISLVSGIGISLLLTAALIALFFLAERAAGTPFPPFDLFDLLARALPGPLVTFGIDLIVSVINLLGIGDTDQAAKIAERAMGIGLFGVLGVVSGVIYFAVINSRFGERGLERRDGWVSGLLLGLLFGVPMLAITASINVSATASMGVSVVLLLVLYGLWGMSHGLSYAAMTEPTGDGDAAKSEVLRLNRRQFLIRLGAASATITVVGAGLGALLGANEQTTAGTDGASGGPEGETGPATAQGDLPNADAAVQPAPGTRAELTPVEDHYRIDINTGGGPVLDADDWALEINGLVENPTSLTLDQLRDDFESMDQYITMGCISNRIAGDLISTTLWTGVSMQRILDVVQPTEDATYIKITSADGFDEFLSLDLVREDESIMLAYNWGGEPLPQRHGFPLRVHIPDRYGMKQPKWITNMEFVSEWEEGYWVRRGWDRDAIVRATSVIDTVATDMMIAEADGSMLIPVGGIAWAGARGISRVEVSVDGGEWQEAQLRDPLSGKTWVIWRFDWPFEEGQHTFQVRCYDGSGEMQITEPSGVRPDGATGIHEMSVNL